MLGFWKLCASYSLLTKAPVGKSMRLQLLEGIWLIPTGIYLFLMAIIGTNCA